MSMHTGPHHRNAPNIRLKCATQEDSMTPREIKLLSLTPASSAKPRNPAPRRTVTPQLIIALHPTGPPSPPSHILTRRAYPTSRGRPVTAAGRAPVRPGARAQGAIHGCAPDYTASDMASGAGWGRKWGSGRTAASTCSPHNACHATSLRPHCGDPHPYALRLLIPTSLQHQPARRPQKADTAAWFRTCARQGAVACPWMAMLRHSLKDSLAWSSPRRRACRCCQHRRSPSQPCRGASWLPGGSARQPCENSRDERGRPSSTCMSPQLNDASASDHQTPDGKSP